jgi:hypothetical protein
MKDRACVQSIATFHDVYVITELMDTDLHQIIRTDQVAILTPNTVELIPTLAGCEPRIQTSKFLPIKPFPPRAGPVPDPVLTPGAS